MKKALPFGRAVTAGDGEGFMNHLILASGSPRRRELLSLYTTDFTVCVSDFDESAVTAHRQVPCSGKTAPGCCGHRL